MKDYVDASGAYRMFGEDFIDCREIGVDGGRVL